MLVIPSIDIEGGRSRLVFWPGVSSGSGSPTDRPERIARHFVALGAPLIHLVDLDGAKAGQPVNLGTVQEISRAIATPLQLAGGIDGVEQLRLAFAAGATRAVMPLGAVIDSPLVLRECLDVAGDWLAVGLDARPERLREYPWRGRGVPSLTELMDELVEAGVHRFVLSHGGAEPDPSLLRALTSAHAGIVELVVAGGITDVAVMTRLREAGVAGVIVGQALISGVLDYPAAVAAAA